ncbi:MAG: DUF429 domain-containing protein, partial [Betaproteobacteria bacterium]
RRARSRGRRGPQTLLRQRRKSPMQIFGVDFTSRPRALAQAAVDDASGDTLDAALCALAAAVAVRAGPPRYGLPPFDPVEGWIAAL